MISARIFLQYQLFISSFIRASGEEVLDGCPWDKAKWLEGGLGVMGGKAALQLSDFALLFGNCPGELADVLLEDFLTLTFEPFFIRLPLLLHNFNSGLADVER